MRLSELLESSKHSEWRYDRATPGPSRAPTDRHPMNTITTHRVTVAPTTISGHPAVLAECADCPWYDCRASDDAAAIVARNVDAHRDATAARA